MAPEEKIKIEKIDDYRWRIPREGRMRTDGIIYTDERMLKDIRKDQSLAQVANVAWLPGIVGSFLGHAGYPLGLWFSHRRGSRLRSERGGRFSGRGGLRHQLRRQTHALRSEPHGDRRRESRNWWRPSLSTSLQEWVPIGKT